MSISQCDTCRICKTESDSLMHLFVSCDQVRILWSGLENWIFSKMGREVKFSNLDIVLGYLNTDNCSFLFNIIILLTKHYIFISARTNYTPNLVGLKGLLKREYKDQVYRFTEWDLCEKSSFRLAPFNKLFNE